MSAHGLLSSVFSCSLSPKSISKRRLTQTRSLDSALTRNCGTEAEETSYEVSNFQLQTSPKLVWSAIKQVVGFRICIENVQNAVLQEGHKNFFTHEFSLIISQSTALNHKLFG